MPFTGELIFDASNSIFAISGIDAQTKLGISLGLDSDNDGMVSVNPAASGDYKFVMTGAGTGVYHVEIRCVSEEPTVFPTQIPVRYPTNHPITPLPSVSPVPSKQTTAIPTVLPTDGPTGRPTLQTPLTTAASESEVTNTKDSNDEGEDGDNQVASADMSGVLTVTYVVASFICCCICVCMMMVFYKYCYGDMKKRVEIQMEMMRPSQNEAPSNVSAVNFERDLVMQWLIHTVELPMYADKFFAKGYETMRAIQAINSREELARCGIELDGHQALILTEIAALRNIQFGTKGGGEGGGEANNKNKTQYGVDGEGVLITNVGDEYVFELDGDGDVPLPPEMTSGMTTNNPNDTSAWPPPPPPPQLHDNWAQDYYVNTVGGNV
eukprot:687810_1